MDSHQVEGPQECAGRCIGDSPVELTTWGKRVAEGPVSGAYVNHHWRPEAAGREGLLRAVPSHLPRISETCIRLLDFPSPGAAGRQGVFGDADAHDLTYKRIVAIELHEN